MFITNRAPRKRSKGRKGKDSPSYLPQKINLHRNCRRRIRNFCFRLAAGQRSLNADSTCIHRMPRLQCRKEVEWEQLRNLLVNLSICMCAWRWFHHPTCVSCTRSTADTPFVQNMKRKRMMTKYNELSTFGGLVDRVGPRFIARPNCCSKAVLKAFSPVQRVHLLLVSRKLRKPSNFHRSGISLHGFRNPQLTHCIGSAGCVGKHLRAL